jgi:hypothetical protein
MNIISNAFPTLRDHSSWMIKVPSLSDYVIFAHVHFRIAGVRRLTSKRAGERDEVLSVILRRVESNNF